MESLKSARLIDNVGILKCCLIGSVKIDAAKVVPVLVVTKFGCKRADQDGVGVCVEGDHDGVVAAA